MKPFLIIMFFFLHTFSNLFAQNKTIRGRVISNQFEILGYVQIFGYYKEEFGKTDLDGFFKIEIPISTKKITFSSVGLETAIINIYDSCNEVEIVMLLRGSYDFMTPKKVYRQRFKNYKKIINFHQKAVDMNLFKTNKTCYFRVFL